MDELILSLTKKYLIEPLWVKAIIQQESQGNPYAVRYEPNYNYLFQPKLFARHSLISQVTEEITQKMSWGLGQIMGALARQQGHTGMMGELFIPEVNIKQICIRIQDLRTISQNKDDLFCMYNGGPGAYKRQNQGHYPNQSYVDSVNRYLQNFQNS